METAALRFTQWCRAGIAADEEGGDGAGKRAAQLADYHLADGQSGITAIAKLRETYGAVPAFVMSGDTAPECLREARESGHHLLHKPVQPITLRAMMNRLLKSGHRL